MNIPSLYAKYLQHPSVCTDTRKLKSGDLFFALKGPQFNGNLFVEKALDSGASHCVADEKINSTDERIIYVEDTLSTLQALAAYHREQFKIPVIAVTGSNGKTTTKELMHAVLSAAYTTYTTEGNLNNHIGIPLTLLKIRPDAQMAIVEMGANHQREIAGYCQYTQPTHGLITNCGKAHLEGFGGIEGVRKGKGELYDYLRAHKQTAFVNAQLDYLIDMSAGIEHIIYYGKAQTQFSGHVVKDSALLKVELMNGKRISTQLVGDYNIHNVLAAYAVGITFGVSEDRVIEALEKYVPDNHRSQMIQWKNNTVILDAYNANPTSMKAAIQNFVTMQAKGKILALGSMKEMGDESDFEHRALIQFIQQFPWQKVILVGDEFAEVPADMLHFRSSKEAGAWLHAQAYQNMHILVKGSRGTKMEKVLED
ncbi:MAG TPA: UDP-N-acetylmuramoyl-tripeptide--D-alanyl-D-alanine ligase [Ferruginibacter sp.]|nr:UDP-N-acetylmuramoyl-tripeptide--D-alanyl-D-alanine ligase [Ferruginibacter sp.]HRO18542.1 UDP-N-acetylmuramoyl-tripeptide--D-alanyl-D-alanine ligase [Ferruginibacter sp.]